MRKPTETTPPELYRSELRRDQARYRSELLDNILPFWVEYGWDRLYGGVITYLGRRGDVVSTDKAVWFQGRATWMYSAVFNVMDPNPRWLEFADSCREFFLRHCFDNTDQRMYFHVTRDGKPLRKRRYLFSETFATIGLAENAVAHRDLDLLGRAVGLLQSVWRLVLSPDATTPPKINPDTRNLDSHAIYMIMVNTARCVRRAVELLHGDDAWRQQCEDIVAHASKIIMERFYKPELGALLETVYADGRFFDHPEGRLCCPGHAIETGWFLLEEALERKRPELEQFALRVIEQSLVLGWDERFGGILYFVDLTGRASDRLEAELKLWWVHSEALYAALLAFLATRSQAWWRRYQAIRDYVWEHFPDREGPEWFGYLRRDGSVLMDYKGNMWKGPFHIPRALIKCYLAIGDELAKDQSSQQPDDAKERR